MARIVGVSPLTLVARGEGYPAEYVFVGHSIPDDADPKQVELLLEEGHLRDLDEPVEPVVVLDSSDLPVAPARNASREDWEAYLLVLGHDPEALDGLGRDDLRDFGPPL